MLACTGFAPAAGAAWLPLLLLLLLVEATSAVSSAQVPVLELAAAAVTPASSGEGTCNGALPNHLSVFCSTVPPELQATMAPYKIIERPSCTTDMSTAHKLVATRNALQRAHVRVGRGQLGKPSGA